MKKIGTNGTHEGFTVGKTRRGETFYLFFFFSVDCLCVTETSEQTRVTSRSGPRGMVLERQTEVCGWLEFASM